MSITTRLGNVRRHFADTSGWSIAGDVATVPEVSFGAQAWAIGEIGLSVGISPHSQLEITNEANPTAGQLVFEGKYVPNWKRMYRLDLHSVAISGGLGASLVPETPIGFEVSMEVWSKAWGTPILRHRANGAPPARDNRHNYVAGDPTGFLGVAMGTVLGASGLVITTSGGISVKFFQFGSNFIQLARDLGNRDWRSAISRGLSMLVSRNHLQFHFGGVLAGVAGNATFGTGLGQLVSGEVSLSLMAIFVSRLHLFIHHPDDDEDTWRYVYTRGFQSDLTVSAPYKINYRQNGIGRWDQSWAK